MYKIQLIDMKQREILAGLLEAETPPNASPQYGGTHIRSPQTGTINHAQSGPKTGVFNPYAEVIIENFRRSGIDVPQAEADDFIAFEREFQTGR